MNYERKYKEALGWMQGLYSGLHGATKEEAEKYFPELKESEDERIRKGLIKAVSGILKGNTLYGTDVTREEALAWLEKQGQKPKRVSIWKHWKNGIAGNGEGRQAYLIRTGNTYDLSSCLSFECDYIELSELDNLMLEKQSETFNADITNRNDEILNAISTGLTDVGVELGWSDFGGIPIEEIQDWFKKQGEPKDKGEISDGYHTFNELYEYRKLYNAAFFNLLPKELVHKSKKHHDGEECFGGGWFIVMANLPTGQISNHYELKDWDLFQIPEKEVADEWDGHTPQDAADRLHKYLLEKQGENKHTDEVESKFHEGEWIIHQGTENIYQVVACIDNQYQLKYGDNYTVQKCTDVDRCARLWTIADAKGGDVLVHNGCPFIFMGIKDGIVQALEEKLLEGTSPVNFGEPKIDKDYQPSTKEQRDLLFQKMKEAGYEWDSEKKELKKIVPKTLDADKVIEWLNDQSCLGWIEDIEVEKFVERFEKDFGL